MADHPFAFAAYHWRSLGAFRMYLRGWTHERLSDELANAQRLLPPDYLSEFAAERTYRYESFSRGGRQTWE